MLKKKLVLINKLYLEFFVIIALLIGGCFEEKSEYTINSDLSGKATIDLLLTPTNLIGDTKNVSLQDMIKPEIQQILLLSTGVDTWKDISFELTDKGFVHFTGTAYFPNVNKFYLSTYDIPDSSEFLELLFSKDQSGRISIEVEKPSGTGSSNQARTKPTLSEEELTHQVRMTRVHYNQIKPSMQAMYGSLKYDSLLHLPAKIEKISSFEKIDDTTIRIKWQGSQIIENLDKIMTDDEQIKNLIRDGMNPFADTFDESFYNTFIFGQEGPIQVVLSSDSKNLFDYKAEVADARSNYDQMLEKLGLVLTKPKLIPKPIQKETPVISIISLEPGKVRVGGVRLIRYRNNEREILPLDQRDTGYTLSLILDLPEPNLIPTQGRVEKAITDTGENILSEYNRETSFPRLSKDGNTVVFEINLSIPGKNVKVISEVSGTLGYSKLTETKTIDLGLMDFVDGAISQVEGFSINSIRTETWDKENTELDLDVDLPRGHLISTKFYNEDGSEIEVSENGGAYTDKELLSIHYRTKGKFPSKGRIVLEIIDNIPKHEIKFKLTNISLTGEPL